jgi:hypothetical protein
LWSNNFLTYFFKSHRAKIIQEGVSIEKSAATRHFVYFQRNCLLFSQPNMHSLSLNSNSFVAASKSAHQSQDGLGSSMGTILLVICSISSRLYFQSQMKRVCGYKSFAKTKHMNP